MGVMPTRNWLLRQMGSRYRDYWACLAIALVAFLLHGSALDGNWRWDDTQVLRHIFDHGSLASFIDADAYNHFSTVYLFPWLLATIELDIWLFGSDPFWFYFHQVFSIAIAGICLFMVAKQWMMPAFAFAAAMLFLSGPPVAVVGEQLMTRHYIEGLIFALISLYAFTRSIEQPTAANQVTSVVFYVLAVTCKEVYVPLILLLPFIPRGSIKTRLKLWLPFVAVAILYVFWRMHMLFIIFGSFSEQGIDMQTLIDIVIEFAIIPTLLFPYLYWLPIFLSFSVFFAVSCSAE